jgi:hypothetical protein
MNRSRALSLIAVVVAASHGPACAGARVGSSLSAASAGGTTTYTVAYGSGVAQPMVTPRNYTPTPQAAQPLGNLMYLGNGMVVPRSSNHFFIWEGKPCQTLNGTTFCQ